MKTTRPGRLQNWHRTFSVRTLSAGICDAAPFPLPTLNGPAWPIFPMELSPLPSASTSIYTVYAAFARPLVPGRNK